MRPGDRPGGTACAVRRPCRRVTAVPQPAGQPGQCHHHYQPGDRRQPNVRHLRLRGSRFFVVVRSALADWISSVLVSLVGSGFVGLVHLDRGRLRLGRGAVGFSGDRLCLRVLSVGLGRLGFRGRLVHVPVAGRYIVCHVHSSVALLARSTRYTRRVQSTCTLRGRGRRAGLEPRFLKAINSLRFVNGKP